MYRKALRAFATVVLLFAFWPVFRIGGLTFFDCTAPFVVIAAMLLPNVEKKIYGFHYAIMGLFIFAFAGVVSMVSSSDPMGHLLKMATLLLALSMMLAFVYTLAIKRIFTMTEALRLLSLSGAIHSFVCILQGRLGLMMWVIPSVDLGVFEWSRLTGLAEHPIEAGMISDFSTVIALGLAMHTKQWKRYLLIALIDVLSLKYSASLTATFALAVGIGAVCVYSRAYKILFSGIVLVVVVGAIGLASGGAESGKLLSRLTMLAQSQGNYGTLQLRQTQWKMALDRITAQTVMIGNGYSPSDLPLGFDIHNGLIAAVYHFGVLGLLSQFLFITFFMGKLSGNGAKDFRSILLGCIVVFFSSYLTGPPFSRRSLWVPMLMLGAYLPGRRQANAPATEFKE